MKLELVPVDQPEADTPPAAPALALEIDIVPMGGKRAGQPALDPNLDKFLREATRQYEEGHIDAPLWTRALAQANDDKETAVGIYLRARATALRLLNRDLRTERRPTPPRAAVSGDAKGDFDDAADLRPGRPRIFASGRKWLIGAAALVPIAAIAWFAIAQMGGTPAKDAPIAQVPPRPVAAAPAAPPAAGGTAAAARARRRGAQGGHARIPEEGPGPGRRGQLEPVRALRGGLDAAGAHERGRLGPAARGLRQHAAIRRRDRGGEEGDPARAAGCAAVARAGRRPDGDRGPQGRIAVVRAGGGPRRTGCGEHEAGGNPARAARTHEGGEGRARRRRGHPPGRRERALPALGAGAVAGAGEGHAGREPAGEAFRRPLPERRRVQPAGTEPGFPIHFRTAPRDAGRRHAVRPAWRGFSPPPRARFESPARAAGRSRPRRPAPRNCAAWSARRARSAAARARRNARARAGETRARARRCTG